MTFKIALTPIYSHLCCQLGWSPEWALALAMLQFDSIDISVTRREDVDTCSECGWSVRSYDHYVECREQ